MTDLAVPPEQSRGNPAVPSSRAVNLASPTKTVAMWEGITPRWLLQFLPYVEVKAGVYRVNRASSPARVKAGHTEGELLDSTFTDYAADPEEIRLATIQTTINIHTRVADLLSAPHDQTQEQIRLAVAAVKEQKEALAIRNLLQFAEKRAPEQIIEGGGAPTPDHLDDLLSRVWKWPAFFLAHPGAIAAFGREATARGVKLDSVEIFGVPFVAWRGVPIVPTNKIAFGPFDDHTYGYSNGFGDVVSADGKAAGGETQIVLLRVGEDVQGVVGLHQAGVGTSDVQSLNIRKMGITREGIESYLITCYFNVAVLAHDAIAVLKVTV